MVTIIDAWVDVPLDYKGGVKPPWRQRKEAYLAHVRSADPGLLRVTIADKVDNARAIVAVYQLEGDRLWERFNAGQKEQLWYFKSCLDAYDSVDCRGLLLDELRRLVNQIQTLADDVD